MKRVLIVGSGDLAQLVFYQIETELGKSVAGFAVSAAYRDKSEYKGLPVVDLETIERDYPATDYDLFVAIGYADGNHARQKFVHWANGLGYSMPSLVSPDTTVQSTSLGPNVSIMAGTIIQPATSIGAGTIIRNSVVVTHHGSIGEACFIASGVIMGGKVNIGDRTFIGLGSRIRDGVQIADDVVIGMGSSVTKDIVDPG